jgi:hypothetical protein
MKKGLIIKSRLDPDPIPSELLGLAFYNFACSSNEMCALYFIAYCIEHEGQQRKVILHVALYCIQMVADMHNLDA